MRRTSGRFWVSLIPLWWQKRSLFSRLVSGSFTQEVAQLPEFINRSRSASVGVRPLSSSLRSFTFSFLMLDTKTCISGLSCFMARRISRGFAARSDIALMRFSSSSVSLRCAGWAEGLREGSWLWVPFRILTFHLWPEFLVIISMNLHPVFLDPDFLPLGFASYIVVSLSWGSWPCYCGSLMASGMSALMLRILPPLSQMTQILRILLNLSLE